MSHHTGAPVRPRADHNGETVKRNHSGGPLENHPSVRAYYAGARLGKVVRERGGILAMLRRAFGGAAAK